MTTLSSLAIVGVAGLPRSGKDEVAKLYIQNGWFGVSLGDIVREEAARRHKSKANPISVKNMTETSNYLRSQKGSDFALKEAIARYEQAQKTQNYRGLVVYSVRAPIEAEFIIDHDGELVWVEARNDVRHQRSINNLRSGEAKLTLEEMLAQEALQAVPQAGIPKEIQMNTTFVAAKATIVIENNGNDLEVFKQTAKQALRL